MKKQNIKWLALLLWPILAQHAAAFPPDYGPFPDGNAQTNNAVQEWTCVADVSPEWVFRPSSNATESVKIAKATDEALPYTLTIVGRDGKESLQPTRIPGGDSIWGLGVFTGKINDDGIADFVLLTWWGTGQGILAGHRVVIFVLSSPSARFTVVPVESWGADPRTDLVDIDHDGTMEFIQTSFLQGGVRSKDSRLHNYWVHNLLRFQGTNCVPANTCDSRFPMWVWYKFKPNHEDDPLLPPSERERLWREQGGAEQSYGSFPMKSLLKEQIRPPGGGLVR